MWDFLVILAMTVAWLLWLAWRLRDDLIAWLARYDGWRGRLARRIIMRRPPTS